MTVTRLNVDDVKSLAATYSGQSVTVTRLNVDDVKHQSLPIGEVVYSGTS